MLANKWNKICEIIVFVEFTSERLCKKNVNITWNYDTLGSKFVCAIINIMLFPDGMINMSRIKPALIPNIFFAILCLALGSIILTTAKSLDSDPWSLQFFPFSLAYRFIKPLLEKTNCLLKFETTKFIIISKEKSSV